MAMMMVLWSALLLELRLSLFYFIDDFALKQVVNLGNLLVNDFLTVKEEAGNSHNMRKLNFNL